MLASFTVFMASLPSQLTLAHIGHSNFLTQNLARMSLSPPLMLGGMGLALMAGAGHALSPGHGKTMVAAYLIGSRGTPQHAILLGLVTTLTHTISVFALGLLALLLARYVLPERLYPFLSLLSGLMVCGVGFWLLDRFLNPVPKHHHSHNHTLNYMHHPVYPQVTLSLLWR